MSGGHFDYASLPYELEGAWRDEEINELIEDLFFSGDFAVRNYGGLFQSLDFWLSADTCEEDYRKSVAAFKQKWFRRTPKNRVEYYQAKLQERCDELKKELCYVE